MFESEHLQIKITALARQFGLSRSTLLYYDRTGLLAPSIRNASGHRLYSEKDRARLRLICQLRSAGVSVDHISSLLRSQEKDTSKGILARHLSELGRQITALRSQQERVARLLLAPSFQTDQPSLGRAEFIKRLESAGLDENEMSCLHSLFEETHPEAHQAFLNSLGFSAEESRAVRQLCRQHSENKGLSQ